MKVASLIFTLFFYYNLYTQVTTISGIIEHQKKIPVSLFYYDDAIKGKIPVADTVTDMAGNFSISFKLTEEKSLRLQCDFTFDINNPKTVEYYIWAKPGKTTAIILKNDTTIYYNGHSSEENNLLKVVGLHRTSKAIKYSGEGVKKFAAKVDAQLAQRLSLFYQNARLNTYSSSYKSFVKPLILYTAYRSKFYVIAYEKSLTKEDYASFSNSVNLLSDKAYTCITYRNGLREYFELLAYQAYTNKTASYLLHYFRFLDSKLKNHKKTKEFLKVYLLKSYGFANENNIDSLKEAISSVLLENPESHYLLYLNKKLQQKITLLYATKSLPDINLKDTSGKELNLKDFTGKVVFIDFWGSWCAPCIEQMPFSQKLHKEIKSNDVVYLYLNSSVEPDTKWKETIRRLGLTGIHLKLTPEDDKKLQTYYSFDRYPFYIIHDKTGKALSVESGINPKGNAKDIIT